MNQNNRKSELAIDNLAMMLEALEEYIRRADYFSDFTKKEQFFRRTIPDKDNEGISLECDEEHFLSQLFHFYCATKGEPESLRKETQKEFYKWIDHSEITAENCPEKLKHFLNEINEILENQGDKFYQALRETLDDRLDYGIDLKNPTHWQAYQEVNKALGCDKPMGNLPKYYKAKINGNAEQGQENWQQIKNSIVSSHDWNFPWRENYYRQLREKIKELEGKNDKYHKENQPKNCHDSPSSSQKNPPLGSVIFGVLVISFSVIFSLGVILVIKKKKNKK